MDEGSCPIFDDLQPEKGRCNLTGTVSVAVVGVTIRFPGSDLSFKGKWLSVFFCASRSLVSCSRNKEIPIKH